MLRKIVVFFLLADIYDIFKPNIPFLFIFWLMTRQEEEWKEQKDGEKWESERESKYRVLFIFSDSVTMYNLSTEGFYTW
jgi:hypothetical protein